MKSSGQAEGLIKVLVVAIIAVIAIAVAKSYFQKASEKTQTTVEEIYPEAGYEHEEEVVALPITDTINPPVT